MVYLNFVIRKKKGYLKRKPWGILERQPLSSTFLWWEYWEIEYIRQSLISKEENDCRNLTHTLRTTFLNPKSKAQFSLRKRKPGSLPSSFSSAEFSPSLKFLNKLSQRERKQEVEFLLFSVHWTKKEIFLYFPMILPSGDHSSFSWVNSQEVSIHLKTYHYNFILGGKKTLKIPLGLMLFQ